MQVTYNKVKWFIPSILLIIAAFDMPYQYYTLLRLIISLVAGYICYKEYVAASSLSVFSTIFGVTALLFNPIIPIHFHKDTWFYIDIFVSLLFLIHGIYILKGKNMGI